MELLFTYYSEFIKLNVETIFCLEGTKHEQILRLYKNDFH